MLKISHAFIKWLRQYVNFDLRQEEGKLYKKSCVRLRLFFSPSFNCQAMQFEILCFVSASIFSYVSIKIQILFYFIFFHHSGEGEK